MEDYFYRIVVDNPKTKGQVVSRVIETAEAAMAFAKETEAIFWYADVYYATYERSTGRLVSIENFHNWGDDDEE